MAKKSPPHISGERESLSGPAIFGKDSRHLRTIYGKNLKEWGEALNMDPSHLSKLERGRSDSQPRLEQIEGLRVLGVGQEDIDLLRIAAGYVPENVVERIRQSSSPRSARRETAPVLRAIVEEVIKLKKAN